MMKIRTSFLLLLSMILIYGVANCLPAVNIDVNTNFWNRPDVPNGIHTIIGYGCTLYAPSGWLAFLVHFIGIIMFIFHWLKRCIFSRYWVIFPLGSLVYALCDSVFVLQRDPRNELLIGNYLWVLSLLMAIALYWRLTRKDLVEQDSAHQSTTAPWVEILMAIMNPNLKSKLAIR